MRYLLPLVPVTAFLLAPSSCTHTFIPVKDTVLMVGLAEPGSRLTKSGLTIVVEPVSVPEFRDKAPAYCVDTRVAVCREKIEEMEYARINWTVGATTDNPNVAVGCAPLVDLAFRVEIKNDTAHSVDLGSAVMQLEAADGTVFEPLRGNDRCEGASTVTSPRRQNPNAWPGSMRVLPERQRDTVAAFCFGDMPPRFPMNLLIFDVPVETDTAGTVTKRENFSFKLAGGRVERYLSFGNGGTATWSTLQPRCSGSGEEPPVEASPVSISWPTPDTESVRQACQRVGDAARFGWKDYVRDACLIAIKEKRKPAFVKCVIEASSEGQATACLARCNCGY